MAKMSTERKPLFDVYRSHRGLSILVCDILIVLMMGCFGFGYDQVGPFFSSLFNPGNPAATPGQFMTFFAVFIAIEGLFSSRRAKDLEGQELFLFRAAEFFTITIFLKTILLLTYHAHQLLPTISSWETDFLGNFLFADGFFFHLLFILMVWILANKLADEFDLLHDREQDASWDELGKVQNALHIIRGRIIAQVSVLGIFLLFMAVLARVDTQSTSLETGLAFRAGIPVVNVVVFFILTLVLLSQTQFAMLRTRWIWNRLPVAPGMNKNWLRYSLIFFFLVGLVALVLPTGYSISLLDLITYFFQILFFIAQVILFIFLLPFSLCKYFGGQQPLPPTPPALPKQEFPPVNPSVIPAANPFWQVAQSIAFWAATIAITIAALWYFFKYNRGLFMALNRIPIFHWIGGTFGSIWNWLRGINRQVVQMVEARLDILRTARRQTARRIALQKAATGPLSARERVIQLYLSMLDEAQESGLRRQASQTPYQISQQLTASLPDVTPELSDLTESFIEARYTQHLVEEQQLSPLRQEWEKIKKAIRQIAGQKSNHSEK